MALRLKGLNYKNLNVLKRLILVCIGYTTKLYIVYFAVLSELIKYILLDGLVCRITENHELCRILTSLQGESNYKQQVKILSDSTRRNI